MDTLKFNLPRSKTGQCFYCERTFDPSHYGTNKGLASTRDHIIPLSKGGRGDGLNLLRCCADCNKFKGSSMPEFFLEKVIATLSGEKKYKTLTEANLYTVKKNVARLIEEFVKPNLPMLYRTITMNSSLNFNLKMNVSNSTRQELKFKNSKELLEMKNFADTVLSKDYVQKFLDKYKDHPARNFHYAERNIHR